VQLARSRLFLLPTKLAATKIRRGENVNLLQRSTRKKLNGRNCDKSTFSLVLSFFALEKRKNI